MDENEMTVESTEENLFDDEPTSEVENETEAETTETTETTEPVDTPFELQVKFNGEERTLNEEDARMYAQKGMNYDRFYEPLERLARMNNMSVGDYINQLNDTQVQYEVEKEKDNLRNDPKYENVSDEVLDLRERDQDEGKEVWLELGLQSAIDETLDLINRHRQASELFMGQRLPLCHPFSIRPLIG